MTRTVHFSFKPQKEVTTTSIEDLLKQENFKNFKICLPKENIYTGPKRGLRRGFVYIRFHDRSDALRLVDTMNGKKFFSGTLRISMKCDEDNVYSSDERLSGSDAYEYDLDSD